MALAAGTRIGGYEIVALLGAGGMGEVYRARDTRLAREVAIKILAPHIAADRDAVLRFEREARALASLNHPNIAAIYDVVESGGQPALILELVDGETLADRISRKALPVDEAIEVARQIADALDTAHEAGIVHRDLKPANIKVAGDGRVKVLDFGLAKAIAAASGESSEVDAANSPTITVHGTHRGVILGTAAYMSPEQARGKRVDKRTDIWAFGCVLFEMLTGRRVFSGETTSDVIAAIIERTPDLSQLPAATPAHVRQLIARCLEKDPRRRARDIGDVRAQLESPLVAQPPQPRGQWVSAAALVAVIALAIAIAGVVAWRWRMPDAPPAAAVEFTIGVPANHTLAMTAPAVSPDGRAVAFIARPEGQEPVIWIRPLDGSASRRLEGTSGVNNVMAWSPDGRSLAFFAGSAWKRIDVNGGPAVTILPSVNANLGLTWGRDELLLSVSNRTFLSRVPVAGGSPQPVTTMDTEKENSHRWPRLLPDGRRFLFTVRSDRPENLGIRAGSLDSPGVTPLVNAASPGVYAEPGWLLYMTAEQILMAHRFDASTQSLSGAPQPIAAPVRYNGPSFSGGFDASQDGRVLAYVPGARSNTRLMWYDRTGKPQGAVGPERDYLSLRVSPNGRTIAVELPDPQYGTRDLWLIDAMTQALTRLTTNPATDWKLAFAPDSKAIAFSTDRAGASTIYRTTTDGGAESLLYRDPAAAGGVFALDWSRDGRLLVSIDSGVRANKVRLVPVDGGAPTTPVETERAGLARLSPAMDRIAVISSVTGTEEVYVVTIADGRRVRISSDGGTNPVWGADGRELFFHNGRGDIMRAVLDGGPNVLAAPPAVALRPCADQHLRFGNAGAEVPYDVAADGRFLVGCSQPEAQPTAITVVVNWQSRLR